MGSKYKKKIIIFDFDGTIADSFSVLVRIIKSLVEKELGREVLPEEVEQARNVPMKETIAKIGLGRWKLLLMLRKAQKKFRSQIGEVKPFEGIVGMITSLKGKGFRVGILSSSDSRTIAEFLKDNDLEIFDFVRSKRNLFGKAPEIRKILKRERFSPKESFYVGDEVRDIEAARKAKVESIAVTWGLNSKKALEEADPDFLVDSILELRRIIEDQ